MPKRDREDISSTLVASDAHRAAFAALLKDETLADVVFIVEGQRFPAMRSILAVRSEMFKSMLMGHFKESNEKEITLDNIGADTFEMILEWIYAGSVDVTVGESITLQKHADYFMLPDLKEACQEVTRSLLSLVDVSDVDTPFKCLVLCLQEEVTGSCRETFFDVKRYIAKAAHGIVLSESWLKLSEQALLTILSLFELNIKEDLLFDRTCEWVHAHTRGESDDQKALLERVLKNICLPKMSEKYLWEKVRPMLKDHVTLKERYLEAVEYKLNPRMTCDGFEHPLCRSLVPMVCPGLFHCCPSTFLNDWVKLFETKDANPPIGLFPRYSNTSRRGSTLLKPNSLATALEPYNYLCMGIYCPDSTTRIKMMSVGMAPNPLHYDVPYEAEEVTWKYTDFSQPARNGNDAVFRFQISFGKTGSCDHIRSNLVGEFEDGLSVRFSENNGDNVIKRHGTLFLYARR